MTRHSFSSSFSAPGSEGMIDAVSYTYSLVCMKSAASCSVRLIPCIYGIAILTSASKTSSPYLLLSVLRMSKRQSSVSCKNLTTSSPRIHMTFVRTTFRSLFPRRHLRRRRSSTEGKETKEGGRREGEERK